MWYVKESELITRLGRMHPNAECELTFSTPYQLLVAVILSAQCTDKRVNLVTKELFAKWGTPQEMLTLSPESLEKEIKSCGFYHNKAKNILAMTEILVDRFGGEVPKDRDILETLPGVGRKTANVVYAVAFGGNAIAVDTHVFRLSHRLALSDADTPFGVERDLMARFPEKDWSHLHHLLIHHGRYICKAQSPKCEECLLTESCAYYSDNHKGESVRAN
ncbi:MAG TPA: endonuclease III [Clostridiales bacterium]|nr:endonuclease III [Clostridiales bacterium]